MREIQVYPIVRDLDKLEEKEEIKGWCILLLILS